jgi:hypothetical protein
MIAIILIAIVAGCASALMFASIISGALTSLLLFYLAPLPLMLAGLVWGPLCATLGGIAAALGVGALFGLPYLIAYSMMCAVPAWWLTHLALLGRPMPQAAAPGIHTPPDLEWYPIGRILLWVAIFAAVTTFAALLTLGTDAATINATLGGGLHRILQLQIANEASETTDQIVDAIATIAPAAAVIVTMTTMTLNVWLAAKIAAASGSLSRPWPDLRSATLPPLTLVALCVAVAFCFGGGMIAIAARIATASIMMAYAVTGFAVLHTLTLALKSRALWLGTVYAMVLMFVWPVLAVFALGLADAVFGVRERFLRSRPPPLPTS